jgi:hypothetical protein
MSRIPGIAEVFEKEVIDGSVVPSQIEIKNQWRRMEVEIEFIESMFNKVKQRCILLEKWARNKLVDPIQLDETEYDLNNLVLWLERVHERVMKVIGLDFPLFTDGGGI